MLKYPENTTERERIDSNKIWKNYEPEREWDNNEWSHNDDGRQKVPNRFGKSWEIERKGEWVREEMINTLLWIFGNLNHD